MNVLKVASYPEAQKALCEGVDVAVLERDEEYGDGHYGRVPACHIFPYCHVMTFSDDLAVRITKKTGWREVARGHSYICLLANGKRADEIFSALGSLTP